MFLCDGPSSTESDARMNIETLRQQHDELESLTASLLAAVSSDKRQVVGSLRWRLARTLMAHLALEDRFLYPLMLGSEDARISAIAAEFRSEMGGLADAFATYMTQWSDHAIIEDWPSFCKETRTLLSELGKRMERENHEMYPLMDALQSRFDRSGSSPLIGESEKRQARPIDGRRRVGDTR